MEWPVSLKRLAFGHGDLSNGLGSWPLGWVFAVNCTSDESFMPSWQGHSLCREEVVLEGVSFAPPGLFL